MKRVPLDMDKLREQLEIIDVYADRAAEDEMLLLDGVGDLLSDIVDGKVVLFYKETK